MTLTIRLLGPPAIERDGRPAPPPRGRKAWALLAFLLLTDQPDDPVPLLALGGELLEVARNPMEEANHELLVRSLAAAGDRAAALRQVAVGADILCRELGAVASQLDWTACAGRSPTRPPAATRRCRARPLSPSASPGPRDPGPRPGAGVRGMHASDMGDYPSAFRYLEGSVELARGCGDQRQQASSPSILARAHLLRDERSQAAAALAGSLDSSTPGRWPAASATRRRWRRPGCWPPGSTTRPSRPCSTARGPGPDLSRPAGRSRCAGGPGGLRR